VCFEIIDGDRRCQLDREHEGEHDATKVKVKQSDYEVVADEEIEEADV
jgi:hypothetical protein